MRKILIIFLVIALFIGVANYLNTNPAGIARRLRAQSETKGGSLTYTIYLFGFIPVGEAVFSAPVKEVFEDRNVLHLNATARPLKIISGIFKGYAALDSYIDIDTGDPILFKQKTLIGNKVAADKEARYDQKNNVMEARGEKRQILAHTQDPLSLTYNIRKMTFNNIADFDMNINTNQKNYIFEARGTPKEIRAGYEKANLFIIKSTIRRRDKNRYHRSQVELSLWKEKGNLPILVKVSASGFYLVAKLSRVK
jgi:hypothetical protein